MTSFLSVFSSLPGKLVYAGALFLAAGQLAAVIQNVREGRSKGRILFSLLHFMLGFVFLTLVMQSMWERSWRYTADPPVYYPFEELVFAVPWAVYLALELLSAAVLAMRLRDSIRWRKSHMSPSAVREAVDLLPAGVCVSEPDGTVVLTNLKMNELSRTLTGGPLTDADRFRESIAQHGTVRDGDTLVHTPRGETWEFSEERLRLGDSEYRQMLAADMTAQYRVTAELREKNRRLKEVQARMKALAAHELELVTAREVMNARVTVHNQLGNVLLSGRYYLDHPESMDDAELLRLLEYSSSFLLGEAEQPEPVPDTLERAVQTARKIGVTVELQGAAPQDARRRDLLARAVNQCAANTARHAEGDRLTVRLRESGTQLTAVFTNNGRPPAGPIAETGGLAALRRTVEAAGGSMTVESAPAFRLILTFQDGNMSAKNN